MADDDPPAGLSAPARTDPPGRRRRWRAPAAGALLACAAGAGAVLAAAGPPRPDTVRAVVESTGAGPLVAVLGVAALTLLFVPRSVVALLGGAVFGPVAGATYVVAGATLGAAVAFVVGAMLGQEYLARRSGRRWRRVRHWLQRRGFAAVVYARLLPMVPFGMLNYGFGATGMPLRVFTLGTLIGITPTTVVYAAFGRVAATAPASLLAVAAVAALPPLVYGLRRVTGLPRMPRGRRSRPAPPRPGPPAYPSRETESPSARETAGTGVVPSMEPDVPVRQVPSRGSTGPWVDIASGRSPLSCS